MSHAITVPRQGWSMEEGTFVEWCKKEGDEVRVGEPLFVLESDKSTETIEAIDAGVLRFTAETPQAGARVKVGQVLGYLGDAPVGQAASPPVPLGQAAGLPVPTVTVHKPSRQAISPRARRVARELGVDWSKIQGSGRTGRIRERDIRAATGSVRDGQLIPHTAARRTLAGRMVAAVTQAAPVTLTTRADATNLVNLRRQFQAVIAAGEVPSYTDLIVKLAAEALNKHELLLAQWRDEGLYLPSRRDLAIAVDTESGLLAPVIRNVDQLTIYQVADQSRELIAQARAGRLRPDQMRDGTFTVSNLGMFGIDAFTPLLNLPQSSILGVGQIQREPVVVNEAVVPRHVLTLSLTFDHRVMDGAPAGRFLAELKKMIEQPMPHLIPRGSR